MKKEGSTQLQRLFSALQQHPEGLTSIQIVNMYILNYKGRIFDLRRGKLNNTPYDIECTRVKGGTWKYTLISERRFYAEKNGQLSFIGA